MNIFRIVYLFRVQGEDGKDAYHQGECNVLAGDDAQHAVNTVADYVQGQEVLVKVAKTDGYPRMVGDTIEDKATFVPKKRLINEVVLRQCEHVCGVDMVCQADLIQSGVISINTDMEVDDDG